MELKTKILNYSSSTSTHFGQNFIKNKTVWTFKSKKKQTHKRWCLQEKGSLFYYARW